MSLINDALKKAQKQRTGEAPPLASMPAIGGESARNIASRGKASGHNPLLLRIGLGAVALVGVIGITVMLLRDKPANSTPPAPMSAAVAQAAPAPAPTVAPATETVFVLPIAAPPTNPTPIVRNEPKAESPVAVAPTPVAAAEPAPPESVHAPVAPAKLEPRAMTFIDNIRVAGIRASSTDSKVLMNDRVYRVGDIVEHEMGLRLVEITSSSLTFEDAAGGRFTRNF